jgi:hypothetical protein
MPKITIEIDDVLPVCVESAIDQVRDLLVDYIVTNKSDEVPCLSNDLDYSGRVHEIIDGAVPVYTRDIEAAWFLHASELEEAYEDAGIGNNPRENEGMTAIYFYIEQRVNEWYSENAQEIFNSSQKGVEE